ncbi:MAG: 1-acyl-sn-glycerol-3-phosphate acyltransferase [Myxococcota bacterium]|jgi:1-acyl-sn-glycerol-3-phosphate acyltransferase
MSKTHLLRSRRFWPLFWTQFSVAFNDNVFRNGIILLITYRGAVLWGLPPEQMVAMATAILLVPFFLFSAPAGELTDKYSKSTFIRRVKLLEIGVMLIGAVGFWLESVPLLLVTLFAMGFQSAMFGPAKYAIIPELLEEDELVAGNAWVELGTYVSVLLGTTVGGLLIASGFGGGPKILGVAVVVFAIAGYFCSRWLVPTEAANPTLKARLDPIRPAKDTIAIVWKDKTLWNTVLGISWFWAFGTIFLALFPTYAKDVLHADEIVSTLLTALFSVGVGAGSLVCERLSRERVELGLVPLGSVGLTVFSLAIFAIGEPWTAPADGAMIGMAEFLSRPMSWLVLFNLLMLSMSGGLFVVPLYTMLQTEAVPEERSRVIAGANIVNSAFMVGGSVGLMGLFAIGLTAWEVFLLLGIVNVGVATYIYLLIPEFTLRFVAWIMSNFLYRLRVEGLKNIPREGGAVLVCNHVTFVDWIIVGGACRRPVRFLMDAHFKDIPVARRLMKHARIIPIASAKRDPEILEQAMETIAAELAAGEIVCIFPEGVLTDDGTIQEFKSGVERIIARTPVPVIPMALNGLWGSSFSRIDGKMRLFRRFYSVIHLTIGPPIPPEGVTAEGLRGEVEEIWKSRAALMP